MSDHKRFDNEEHLADRRQARQDRRILPHHMSPARNTTEDCVPVIEDMVQGMISLSGPRKCEGGCDEVVSETKASECRHCGLGICDDCFEPHKEVCVGRLSWE